MSRYLCTRYEGPDTWDKPIAEWSEHDRRSPSDAAEDFVSELSGGLTVCELEDGIEVAVSDGSGGRWTVCVYGEVDIHWDVDDAHDADDDGGAP